MRRASGPEFQGWQCAIERYQCAPASATDVKFFESGGQFHGVVADSREQRRLAAVYRHEEVAIKTQILERNAITRTLEIVRARPKPCFAGFGASFGFSSWRKGAGKEA